MEEVEAAIVPKIKTEEPEAAVVVQKAERRKSTQKSIVMAAPKSSTRTRSYLG